MKRLLMLITLSGFAMACGDDEDDGPDVKPDAGGDAAVKPDTGTIDAAVGAKVTNAGAACTMATQCTGTAATCATAAPTGQPFPGGYCSASCSTAAECGTSGDCPLGELITALGVGTPALMGLTAGQCWEKCTAPGTVSTCRTGYACTTLGAAVGSSMQIGPLLRPVCLPIPGGDGGVRDAGPRDASVVDAAGLDAAAP